MNSIELKTFLHTKVDEVNDTTVLQAFVDMMNAILNVHQNKTIGFDADELPITQKQLEAEVVAASERVKAGNYISHDDLKKQMENW